MSRTTEYHLDTSRARAAFPVERQARVHRVRHGLTPAQNGKYWREWGRARKVLRAAGYTAQEADAERHELHAQALGHDKPHADLTNADFDKVLAAFLAISESDNLDAQIAGQTGSRRRLEYSIEKLVKGREEYVREICTDCGAPGGDWRRLSDDHLANLRKTLAHRVERKRTETGAQDAPSTDIVDEARDGNRSVRELNDPQRQHLSDGMQHAMDCTLTFDADFVTAAHAGMPNTTWPDTVTVMQLWEYVAALTAAMDAKEVIDIETKLASGEPF